MPNLLDIQKVFTTLNSEGNFFLDRIRFLKELNDSSAGKTMRVVGEWGQARRPGRARAHFQNRLGARMHEERVGALLG